MIIQNIKEGIKRNLVRVGGWPSPLSLIDKAYRLPNQSIMILEPASDKVYCNINFDDQCPVYGEFLGRDYGGHPEGGIARKLELFLQRNPEVAITSFVIPHFLGNRRKYENEFLVSSSRHKAWVTYNTDLARRFKVEFALHGYFHHQKENPFFMSHAEFAFKEQALARTLISKGMAEFKAIGWHMEGFRQPGWDLSVAINLPAIAQQLNLKYIASNSINAGLNARGVQRVSNDYPTRIGSILNFPQNIELDWPIEKIYASIDELVLRRALISIKGHFVDKDVCNCLSDANFDKLQQICDYIHKKHEGVIEFITLSELSKRLSTV